MLRSYDIMLLNSERVARWSALVSIAVFLLLSATQAYKPLQLDSADLPVWAAAVAKTGKPIAYRWERHQSEVFLYHTPLYLYGLAGWFKIFGYGPSQVRLFGALCAVTLGLVTFSIFRSIIPVSVCWTFGAVFWPLFLLNPYTVQGAAIADMDTTIYGPLLCGFVLCVIRLSFRNGEVRVATPAFPELLLCSVILALSFWTKLTTVLLFLPYPLFLLWPRFGLFRAVRVSTAVLVIGISLFLVTFVAWCKWVGADPLEFWRRLLSYALTRGSSGHGGLLGRLHDFENNFLYMGPFTLKWTGLLPWAGVIAAFGYCGAMAVRRRNLCTYAAGITFGFAGLGSMYYSAQQLTFGNSPYKYNYVFWGIISAGAAYLYAVLLEPKARLTPVLRRWIWIGSLGIFSGAVFLGDIYFKDGVMRLGSRDFLPSWPYWLLPTAIFCLIACAFYKRQHLLAAFAIMLVAFHVGLELGVTLYQVRQTYSTTYNYGQEGLTETAWYLRSVTNENDVIAALKDLGPLTQRRYYENYGYLYGGEQGADKFIGLMTSRTIRYAVFTENLGEDQLVMNARLQDWIARNCRVVKSIGNYRVYELTPK
jgi:hypothetical protein